MALTNAFYEAVESGNVRRVRIMMKDSLLVDPTFREFKEMEKAGQLMQGLYDTHDGREFEINKSEWDNNYLDKQMVQVVGNFSHERIGHLKDIVKHLLHVEEKIETNRTSNQKQTRPSYTTQNISYEEQKRRDQKDGRYLGAKVATGVAMGATVGGVVAHTAGVTVVGGAITGAVIGGVVVAVIENGGS